MLDRAKAVPGVERAAGGVFDQASVIGKDGDRVDAQSTPNFVASDEPAPFNPCRYVQGRAPSAPDEVAIDRKTVSD